MGQPEGKGNGPTGRPLRRRRVIVGDARSNGTYLRTTWHAENEVFVVSTWNEEVCTAAVRVPVEGAAELAGLLVDGLAEAARSPAAEPPSAVGPREGKSRGKRAERGLLTLRRDLEAWVRHARGRLGAAIGGHGERPSPAPPSPPRPAPTPPPTGSPPTASPPDEIRWTA
jgi:hypothetical protein